MNLIRNAALTAAAAFALSACEPKPAAAPGTTPTDPQWAAERFIPYFDERCAAPIRAGRAPDVEGLVPVSPAVAASYPKVPAYKELRNRALSFWTDADDTAGGVILIVEQGPRSTRCAVATRAFDAAEFARVLKLAYPDVMAASPDERVINLRLVIPGETTAEESKVYSTYHDPEGRVSALVLSESEGID